MHSRGVRKGLCKGGGTFFARERAKKMLCPPLGNIVPNNIDTPFKYVNLNVFNFQKGGGGLMLPRWGGAENQAIPLNTVV